MRIQGILFFLFTAYAAVSQTFTSTVNQAVPDNGTAISFSIEVSGLPDSIHTGFGLVQVCVNILHTWDSDMQVRLVSPEVQNAQVLTRIRLTDANVAALRQNQRVQVRVLLEEKPDVMLVERGPAFERDASSAWVIDGDVARRQPIRLGASSVSAFEIVDGLAPGQQVIVAGIDDLRGVDEVLLTR